MCQVVRARAKRRAAAMAIRFHPPSRTPSEFPIATQAFRLSLRRFFGSLSQDCPFCIFRSIKLLRAWRFRNIYKDRRVAFSLGDEFLSSLKRSYVSKEPQISCPSDKDSPLFLWDLDPPVFASNRVGQLSTVLATQVYCPILQAHC